MLDKMNTQLKATLTGLLRSHEAAEIVDALADVLAAEANGATKRGHLCTAREFDRIAVDLWAQSERFGNEDSGQEVRSYYDD